MKTLVEQSFGLNLKILQIMGLYPWNNHPRLYRIYSYIAYFFVGIPVPALAVIHLFFDHNITLMRIADDLYIVGQIVNCICKLGPFMRKPYAIQSAVNYFRNPLFIKISDEYDDIKNECLSFCHKIQIFFTIGLIGSFITWAIQPFIIGQQELPIVLWLPYNLTKSNTVYWTTYFPMISGTFYGALGAVILVNPFIIGIAYNIVTQLKMLKYNLTFLNKHVDDEMKLLEFKDQENLKAVILYKRITYCIQHYDAILEYLNVFDNAFSGVMFFQILSSVLIICASVFKLTLVNPLSFEIFGMMFYITTILVEVFFFCYVGTNIAEESKTLSDAIYLGEWYNYDQKSKKLLIILMERAKRPIIITVAKVVEVSLDTFSTVLRRAYGLFALLQHFK